MPKVNLFHSSKERTIVVSGRVPISLAELLDAKVKEIGTTQNRVVGALIETFVDPESDQLGLRSGIVPNPSSDISDEDYYEALSEKQAMGETIDELEAELKKATDYIKYIISLLDQANKKLESNWSKPIAYKKYD